MAFPSNHRPGRRRIRTQFLGWSREAQNHLSRHVQPRVPTAFDSWSSHLVAQARTFANFDQYSSTSRSSRARGCVVGFSSTSTSPRDRLLRARVPTVLRLRAATGIDAVTKPLSISKALPHLRKMWNGRLENQPYAVWAMPFFTLSRPPEVSGSKHRLRYEGVCETEGVVYQMRTFPSNPPLSRATRFRCDALKYWPDLVGV